MKTVYLCGGINKLSDTDAKDWREEAKAALGQAFKILDPMIRDYRGKELEEFRQIVELDKWDVSNSDIVIVNASRPSWGTAMEVLFAWLTPIRWREGTRRYLVAFGAGDRPSPWLLYHCDELVPTLGAALAAVKTRA